MGLLRSLFSRSSATRHELPDTTDDALNTLLVLLRNRVCDFKDITNMSWTLLLPAIQRISIRLFIQARGHESTQTLLAAMIQKMEEEHDVRPKVVRNITYSQKWHLNNCPSWRNSTHSCGKSPMKRVPLVVP